MAQKKPNVRVIVDKVIKIVGLKELAKGLGINYQAIRAWQDRGRMPDSEYSGRTTYAKKMQIMTQNQVTVEQILGFVPPAQVIDESDTETS